MRARVLVPTLLALLASTSAQAAVQIDINKDTQTMTVAVDGVDQISLAGVERPARL